MENQLGKKHEEKNEPIFCSLAFGSISINGAGQYIPCCNIISSEWEGYNELIPYTDPAKKINSYSLVKLRSELSSGIWPTTCGICRTTEENGSDSTRIIWNRSLENFIIPIEKQIKPENIKFLDLTFGTKCNSKCMTCSPNLSDFWEDEYNKIIKNTKLNKFPTVNPPPRISITTNDSIKIIDTFPNFEYVAFVGGEPTISNEHFEFLKILIKNQRSKNINLSYVTNLTGITEELISLWQNFKSIYLSVSIDGYGRVNEYIRYPFKWKKIQTNLNETFNEVLSPSRDTNYTVGLSYTPSLFNAGNSAEFFEYWYGMLKNYPDSEGRLLRDTSCHINRISWPKYTMMTILPLEYREKEIKKLDVLLYKIEKDKLEGLEIHNSLIDSILLLKNWLGEKQVYDKTVVDILKSFIYESDRYRNRHLKDYIPDLWVELSKL
jgi:hypothetical protein